MGDYSELGTEKFLNSSGTGHLWSKIRERFDSKLDSVVAQDDSIAITNNSGISVVVSAEADNLIELKTSGNKGLYVPTPAAADTYAMVQSQTPGDYAAVYQLMKYTNGTGAGTQVGVDINIPKDMVVSSGDVETKSSSGEWGPAGVYLVLTLANAGGTKVYIPVDSLIEYVTSGSQQGDTVVIDVNAQHQMTATITDGTITKAKFAQGVQDSLDLADSAVQSVLEGSTNGTISVDGTDVPVHGLGSAAYAATTAFDPAGSAAAVLGTSSDTQATMTVYGDKQYSSDAYAGLVGLSNAEIDAIINPTPPGPTPGPNTPTDESGNVMTDESGNALEFDVPNS